MSFPLKTTQLELDTGDVPARIGIDLGCDEVFQSSVDYSYSNAPLEYLNVDCYEGLKVWARRWRDDNREAD